MERKREPELMTEAEYKAWRINYNNINNEGGEGYIPDCVTQEELQAAKERLAKIMKIDIILKINENSALAKP